MMSDETCKTLTALYKYMYQKGNTVLCCPMFMLSELLSHKIKSKKKNRCPKIPFPVKCHRNMLMCQKRK